MSIEENLQEDQDVYGHLDGAANTELYRSITEDEVQGFEHVTKRPHNHHANTEKTFLIQKLGLFGVFTMIS